MEVSLCVVAVVCSVPHAAMIGSIFCEGSSLFLFSEGSSFLKHHDYGDDIPWSIRQLTLHLGKINVNKTNVIL